MITVLPLAKNSHTIINHQLTRCVIMVQNPLLVFPQFYAFLTNCFSQSAHNFKVAFLIDRTTLWQEFIMHHAHCNRKKQWAKPLHLTELEELFSILAFLNAFIGMIGLWFQCHSCTSMIRHKLWPFWAHLDRRWTLSTSPERRHCFCSKFSNFGKIFAASRFMSKTSLKIAWHEPNDMPTSSATSLTVIRRLSKINVFISCLRTRAFS